MNTQFSSHIDQTLEDIKQAGMYKDERIIASQQAAEIELASGQKVLNFCANNYMGLANDPRLMAEAGESLKEFGYGVSSVRFICGSQTCHRQLEEAISQFFQKEDTILFPSCFDANAGVFEVLLTKEDAIISDQLNHASIIDGVRLCKAKRYRYLNNDMASLEEQLKAADQDGARFKLIATDGVFSMDGIIANLPQICDLADKYQATLLVDDSHATGFVGEHGRGTPEYHHVMDRVDIITSTLGKALGGATGGFITANSNIIALLKQKARPYLFSNSLAPMVAKTSIKAFEIIDQADDRRQQLKANGQRFRQGLAQAGFDLIPGEHAIIPVMIYDEKKAVQLAEILLKLNIYVIPFSYPVVPKGLARIRTQMSAIHTAEQIDYAIEAFTKAGKQVGLLG